MDKVKNIKHFYVAIFPMILFIFTTAIIISYFQNRFPTAEDIKLNLLVTLILTEGFVLFKIRLEHIERLSLEKSLVKTRRSFGRENYLSLIRQNIEEAENEVLFTSRSMTTPEKEPLMAGIIQASVKRQDLAKKNGTDFTHRGIIAPRLSTIAGAFQLINKTSIDIRFNDYLNYSTLRFIIIDRKKTIIAIAKPEEKTELSYSFESYTLANALAGEFEKLWIGENVKTFQQYLDELIKNLDDLPNSEKAERLNIPEKIIDGTEKVLDGEEVLC